MDLVGILISVACVGGVGLIISIFLSFFSAKFRVETDEREEKILEILPGNNCGGCGYPGCSGLAKAICEGSAPVNGCPVGGASVAEQVSEIMGVSAGSIVKKTAFVKCSGTCEVVKDKYEYSGIKDCTMAMSVPGKGPKSCEYGCMGFGSCVKQCQFDAIHIIDGIAKVDPEKCTSCGKCVETCPKNLIEIVPAKIIRAVACSSKDKGPDVMKVCSKGCIGCGICAKNCPEGAVTVTDFIAHIDQDKCTKCGICVEKCPKKVIV